MMIRNRLLRGPLMIENVDKGLLREIKSTDKQELITDATEYVPGFLKKQDALVCTFNEIAKCSPVIPTNELIQIRDEAIRRANSLQGIVNSLGGSLESRGVIDSYLYYWKWIEGRNWCIYQKDEYIFNDIQNQNSRANNLLDNAGNIFFRNFSNKWSPMRSAFNELVQAANNATIDIGLCIEKYNLFWERNFVFSLHGGINDNLASLINEYKTLTDRSEGEFNRGNTKVQSNFNAQFNLINTIFQNISNAYSTWDTVDGRKGYQTFESNIDDASAAYQKWSEFVVLKTPENDGKFNSARQWAEKIQFWWQSFPSYPSFSPTAGMVKGGGIPDFKFHCVSAASSLLHNIGRAYLEISSGHNGYEFRNLFVVNLSYEHGGKFPPHSTHRDGRDADVWGRWIDKTKADYDSGKTQEIIEACIRLGASAVLFSDQGVVDAVNKSAETNGWSGRAQNVSGHEDHLHIDV